MSGRGVHRFATEGLIALAVLLAALAVAGITFLDAETEVLALIEWCREQTFWAPVLFIAIYALAVVLVLPGFVLTLGSGFLFGVLEGSVIVVIGETLGATIAFLVGRALFGTRLAAALANHPRFSFVNQRMRQNGWKVVLFTRMIPLFPFKLSNYFFGVVRYPFPGFVLGTLIGVIPLTVTTVYLGSIAADIATLGVRPEKRALWEWFVYAGGLLATMAAAVYVVRLGRQALKDLGGNPQPHPGSSLRSEAR